MAVPRFYAGPEKVQPGSVKLSQAESGHAKSSRRLSVGDEVVLFDGRGGEAAGHISAIERQAVHVRVASVQYRESDAPLQLTLAVSFPKASRQDLLVEKCTELGVATIWPMKCRHSIAEPSAHRIEKLRRTALEASKQAQRAWLCEIREQMPFEDVVKLRDQFDAALIAERSGHSEGIERARSGRTALLLIGPEGGFADEELAAARAAGFAAIQLGRTILRTETAAIAAAARLLTVY